MKEAGKNPTLPFRHPCEGVIIRTEILCQQLCSLKWHDCVSFILPCTIRGLAVAPDGPPLQAAGRARLSPVPNMHAALSPVVLPCLLYNNYDSYTHKRTQLHTCMHDIICYNSIIYFNLLVCVYRHVFILTELYITFMAYHWLKVLRRRPHFCS